MEENITRPTTVSCLAMEISHQTFDLTQLHFTYVSSFRRISEGQYIFLHRFLPFILKKIYSGRKKQTIHGFLQCHSYFREKIKGIFTSKCNSLFKAAAVVTQTEEVVKTEVFLQNYSFVSWEESN